MYTLQTYVIVLTEHNGSLRRAAAALGLPLHTLKSEIDKYAELQAICLNRDLEIADRSRDVVLDVLSDTAIEPAGKLGTAKWALENLASDAYSKKQSLEVRSKAIEEISPEELEARKTALFERMAAPKPVEAFDKLELYPVEGNPRADDASNQ